MRKSLLSLFALACAFALVPSAPAAVEYVRICSLYGSGFNYIAGTDICINQMTGDTRQQTEGGTWRSRLPYPEGTWVSNTASECAPGKLVKLGSYKSTDFALNVWQRKQTAPTNLKLKTSEYISKVMMSGGFYDPRIPGRSGINGTVGLCVRSMDPGVLEKFGDQYLNPPFGAGMLPMGCVANSRIVNMPGAYSITAQAAYPNIDTYFANGDQTIIAGPYVYGSQLVVTTDVGPGGPLLLTYRDLSADADVPLAGTLNAWVCVQSGVPGQGTTP